MSKEEVIKLIKNEMEDYAFYADIDSYIKGFLDALYAIHKITWDERNEIKEALNNE